MGGKGDLPLLHFQSCAVGRGLGLPSDTSTPTPNSAGLRVGSAPTVQGVEVFEDAERNTSQFKVIQLLLLSNSSAMTLRPTKACGPSWSNYESKCCKTLRGRSQKTQTIKTQKEL